MSVITHADGTRVSKVIIRVCRCVILWLFVRLICPRNNSNTNDPKVFKLGIGNDLAIAYGWYDFGVKT